MLGCSSSVLARRVGPIALAGIVCAASAPAQQDETTPENAPTRPETDVTWDSDPNHAFEVALSEESFWLAYRSHFHRRDGYLALGLLANEDDDLAFSARFLRFAEPSADVPIGLGLGIGLFGAGVDESNDKVFALTLTGSVDFAFPTHFPARAVAELSYAPDIVTFDEGQEVIDFLVRAEVDLSDWATGFAGYRKLQVDLKDSGDHDLESAIEIGVRLGF